MNCPDKVPMSMKHQSVGANIAGAEVVNRNVIRGASPVRKEGGLAVFRSNLAPDGAVV